MSAPNDESSEEEDSELCELCDEGRHLQCRGRCGTCLVCEIGNRAPIEQKWEPPNEPPKEKKARTRKVKEADPRRGPKSRLQAPMQHAIACALLDGTKIADIARKAGCTRPQVETIQRYLRLMDERANIPQSSDERPSS